MSTEFHEGNCCIGCINEIEADTGYYPAEGCCCYVGLTPLEQWDYVPKHPPVDGKVPELFYKWKHATRRRYLARFWEQIHETYEVCIKRAHADGRSCGAEECLWTGMK